MDKTHNTNKTNYHHGDLCGSLVQAASVLIQEHGVEALSMRKLADAVGVSRTAPYHHFKDKNALLSAIAEEGFRLQSGIIDSVCDDQTTEITEQFEVFVQSYIRFAIEHPAHYDLMYGGSIWKQKQASESLEKAAHTSFKRWLQRIEVLQQQGFLNNQETATRLAQVTWATLHGLCRLANDGVYIDQDNILDMGRSAARMLMVEKTLNAAANSQNTPCSVDTHPVSSPSSA